jgi:hypothetical protein
VAVNNGSGIIGTGVIRITINGYVRECVPQLIDCSALASGAYPGTGRNYLKMVNALLR